MARKREPWFEYSWFPGFLMAPCSAEGWVLWLAGPAIFLLMFQVTSWVAEAWPNSPLVLIPVGLAALDVVVVNYLMLTRMRRRGGPPEEDVNQTARRLFRP